MGRCLPVAGCVSVNFRVRAGHHGDCVVIGPGRDMEVVHVPAAEENVWTYYAVTM